jgi:hypothetical protein
MSIMVKLALMKRTFDEQLFGEAMSLTSECHISLRHSESIIHMLIFVASGASTWADHFG